MVAGAPIVITGVAMRVIYVGNAVAEASIRLVDHVAYALVKVVDSFGDQAEESLVSLLSWGAALGKAVLTFSVCVSGLL